MPFTPGNAEAFSVAFSPDGRTLATGDDDATIRLWDVADPDHLQSVGQPLTAGTGTVYPIAFSPNGQTLASGSIDGAIRLWDPTVNYATHWIGSSAGDLHRCSGKRYIQQLPYQPLCTN